ncbi:MAG: hypothetical protein U1E05_14405 [Patescibacteria group bacterium]|nr:hypothetical protein [Patescibacteria group bacterium]
MKGLQGLVIAIVLGLAAAVLNWFYLVRQSQQVETVAFVGIHPEQYVERGERLREEQLVAVRIPRNAVGNLSEFAVLDSARRSVVGQPVSRPLAAGRLLLQDDLDTPPPKLVLREDERIMWVPVDSRSFVPSLITPGDMVTFKFPRTVPTPVGGPIDPQTGRPAAPAEPLDRIGPFKVLSVGNRLGSAEVMKAAKIPQMQENVLGISITPEVRAQADSLWTKLQASEFRSVGIEKHGERQ